MYVIRVVLIPEEEKDYPPFGDKDTKYTSIDMETTAHAPILSNDADIYNEDLENLKAYGPFVPTFLTDTKKVGSILLACFGSQVCGNMSRSLLASRTGVKPGIPSTTISLGGAKLTPWSLTSF
jgi:hypothetical protein